MVTNYSGWRASIRRVTAAYTVVSTDCIIFADATTATFQVTLPAAVDNTVLFIKKTTEANIVQIIADGSETIDGDNTLDIIGQNDCVMIAAEGGKWGIV